MWINCCQILYIQCRSCCGLMCGGKVCVFVWRLCSRFRKHCLVLTVLSSSWVVYSKHSVTAYCVELKTSGVQQIHWWVKNTILHVLKMNGVKHIGGLAALCFGILRITFYCTNIVLLWHRNYLPYKGPSYYIVMNGTLCLICLQLLKNMPTN
jgi:hypothetical protein